MSDRTAPALLEVEDLRCSYGTRRRFSRAQPSPVVHGIDLTVQRGQTLGLVGESGSGKTTIARAIAGIVEPDGGRTRLDGEALAARHRDRDASQRRRIQYIAQNPDSALNPRMPVREVLGRPLKFFHGIKGADRDRQVVDLLRAVQLDEGYISRWPPSLSGGERQRVAIARALAADPDVLLCDEVTSALDVSVQAGVVELLQQLQRDRGLACLFITHDLGLVRWCANTVAVLLNGEIVQRAPAATIFDSDLHPYTQRLLNAVPVPPTP